MATGCSGAGLIRIGIDAHFPGQLWRNAPQAKPSNKRNIKHMIKNTKPINTKQQRRFDRKQKNHAAHRASVACRYLSQAIGSAMAGLSPAR